MDFSGRRLLDSVSSSCWFDSGYMLLSVYEGSVISRIFLVKLNCRARRRHGQWYVLAGFAQHDTPHAVFPSIVGWLVWLSSTTVAWLVLLVLTHLALCWHSRCVPLTVGRPKDFGCGGVFTGAVLEQVYCVVYRCCGPDNAFCLEDPQLQLFFKDIDFPVVALRLSHGPACSAVPRDSSSCRTSGGRCPCCAVAEVVAVLSQ